MERRGLRRSDVQAGALVIGTAALTAFAALAFHALLPAAAARIGTLLAVAAAAFSLLARWVFRGLANPTARDMARSDYLTGLRSRNAFEVDMGNLRAEDWRDMGAILMDLDNLKEVNDALGHSAGDQYLCRAAEAVREAVGQNAAAYRVGGDELLLLVRQTDEAGLEELAGRICTSFVRNRPAWDLHLALSAGWALYDGARDRNLWDTCRRADAAMYARKRAGRDG